MYFLQIFSILANEFKHVAILTIEALLNKIDNAPVNPRPICRSLHYIFDWKDFISPNLTELPLSNHTKYHSFMLQKENGSVKFRAKFLPQMPDCTLYPRSGIRLMKPGIKFVPVGPAELFLGDLKFDEIIRGITKYTNKLPLLERMNILSSWENLRKRIESLDVHKGTFKKLVLSNFPKQQDSVDVDVPQYLKDAVPDHTLRGELYDEEPIVGDLKELAVGTDVCVYTQSKQDRPWVGRIVKLLNDRKVVIRWFTKVSRRRGAVVYRAMEYGEEVKAVSEIDKKSIMFWHMTEERTDESFVLSKYWIETIKNEYEVLDA